MPLVRMGHLGHCVPLITTWLLVTRWHSNAAIDPASVMNLVTLPRHDQVGNAEAVDSRGSYSAAETHQAGGDVAGHSSQLGAIVPTARHDLQTLQQDEASAEHRAAVSEAKEKSAIKEAAAARLQSEKYRSAELHAEQRAQYAEQNERFAEGAAKKWKLVVEVLSVVAAICIARLTWRHVFGRCCSFGGRNAQKSACTLAEPFICEKARNLDHAERGVHASFSTEQPLEDLTEALALAQAAVATANQKTEEALARASKAEGNLAEMRSTVDKAAARASKAEQNLAEARAKAEQDKIKAEQDRAQALVTAKELTLTKKQVKAAKDQEQHLKKEVEAATAGERNRNMAVEARISITKLLNLRLTLQKGRFDKEQVASSHWSVGCSNADSVDDMYR